MEKYELDFIYARYQIRKFAEYLGIRDSSTIPKDLVEYFLNKNTNSNLPGRVRILMEKQKLLGRLLRFTIKFPDNEDFKLEIRAYWEGREGDNSVQLGLIKDDKACYRDHKNNYYGEKPYYRQDPKAFDEDLVDRVDSIFRNL